MLSQYPRAHRYFVRASLVGAWVFAAGAGFAATTFTAMSISIVRELGVVLTILCGASLAMGAVWAALGVLFKHYRWEWGASWACCFGISPYVFSVWYVVLFQVEVTRTTQAFLVTSLFLFFLSRAALCGAHAARLRAMHVEGGVVTNAIDTVVRNSGNKSTR
jgi:hypothetical protein